MKRSNTNNEEHHHSKKIKMEEYNVELKPQSLIDLSPDELSEILQFLPVGNILMFAMTCKGNYDWTTGYVESHVCKEFVPQQEKLYYQQSTRQTWSLTNALRQKNSLRVGGSNIHQIEEIALKIAAKNGSICEISNKIELQNYTSFENTFELLDIRKSSNEKIQVETLCIPLPDDHSFHNRMRPRDDQNSIKTKTIEGEPLGYDLKEISIDMTLTRAKLFKILSKLRDLENLELIIEQEYYIPASVVSGRGRGKGLKSGGTDKTIDESGEAFDEEFIYVPIMKNLKRLTIQRDFENDNFIFDLLHICPNLEYLHYVCRESVGDGILEHISETCPKLKSLTIRSDDGATQFELEISDEGLEKFLEKQTQIESIDLEPAACISGSIFKRLGNFPKLKHFRTQRICYNGDCIEQEDDLFFGGNPNPNLKFIDIGTGFDLDEPQFDKLITSLKAFAPNLKNWRDLGQSDPKRSTKIDELFAGTLENIELDLECLSSLPLCINLKQVEINSNALNFEKLPHLDPTSICNLNVTEMVYATSKKGLSVLSKLFPNLKRAKLVQGEFIDYLIENRESWPNLVHLKLTETIQLLQYETLTSQRPNLFIEFEDGCEEPKANVSAQVFYYQWLERDCQQEQ